MQSLLVPSNIKACFAFINKRIRARQQTFKVPADDHGARPDFVKTLAKLTQPAQIPSQTPGSAPAGANNITLAGLKTPLESKTGLVNDPSWIGEVMTSSDVQPAIMANNGFNHSDPQAERKISPAGLMRPMASDSVHKKNPYQKPHRSATHQAIDRHVRNASLKHGVPESIIRGIIKVESSFNTKAVSKSGAQGLMQLMPETAQELGVTEPFDIAQNIDAGTRYLKKLLTRFDGDLKRALAAYNAGPTVVDRHNGEVPFKETRQYVKQVLEYSGHDTMATPDAGQRRRG